MSKTVWLNKEVVSTMKSFHYNKHRLLDSLVLAPSAGGPVFNPQSRTASYQRRYKIGTSSSLV